METTTVRLQGVKDSAVFSLCTMQDHFLYFFDVLNPTIKVMQNVIIDKVTIKIIIISTSSSSWKFQKSMHIGPINILMITNNESLQHYNMKIWNNKEQHHEKPCNRAKCARAMMPQSAKGHSTQIQHKFWNKIIIYNLISSKYECSIGMVILMEYSAFKQSCFNFQPTLETIKRNKIKRIESNQRKQFSAKSNVLTL